MIMIDENPIPQLVARHRRLKEQKAAIDREISTVREAIVPLLESVTGQKWTDKHGYAKMVTPKPTVHYRGEAVDTLAQVWARSTDPVMKSCGEMLLHLREEKLSRPYIQIR